ncbi:hypothetical protein, partial [Ileibacterium valens]|uniref:hypothetical protein n=1 Tax=Ileibacterium valens TaxID=1862668 RepID=UPI00272BF3D7
MQKHLKQVSSQNKFSVVKPIAFSCKENPKNKKRSIQRIDRLLSYGWGTWIRTTEMADSESAAL